MLKQTTSKSTFQIWHISIVKLKSLGGKCYLNTSLTQRQIKINPHALFKYKMLTVFWSLALRYCSQSNSESTTCSTVVSLFHAKARKSWTRNLPRKPILMCYLIWSALASKTKNNFGLGFWTSWLFIWTKLNQTTQDFYALKKNSARK